MKECINCGNETNTRHCSNCGQRIEVARVSFKGVVGEFISKWIGFDTQFGRTIIGMISKPGHVINSYLNGNRISYIGPLGFLVVMTALLIISFDVFGLETKDFIEENQSAFKEALDQEYSENQIKVQEKVNEFIAKNFRFFSVIMIPFWGVSLWLFFKSAKLNYVERTVVAIYMTSEGLWLTILMLGLFAATGQLFNIPVFFISALYYGYCLHKVFSGKNYFVSLLKTVGSLLFAIVLLFVFGVIITVAAGLVLILFNPDLLQQQG